MTSSLTGAPAGAYDSSMHTSRAYSYAGAYPAREWAGSMRA